MTQKKNDCEIILIDEEQRKPIKILKKHVSHMGAIKYLVEYPTDQQWESEKYMKEKYLELVEDYNYFSVCGNRYDQATLNQKRENHQKLASYDSHNYTNLPNIPHDENYPIFKRQKIKDKQIEKMNPTEPQPAITPSKALVETQIQINQQLNSNKADLGDTIKSISIENGLFLIEWNQRPDSTVPYAEYYTYDQLKATAPNILLQFIEKELLENDIKFKQLKRDKANDDLQQLTINNTENSINNKKNNEETISVAQISVDESKSSEEVKEQNRDQKEFMNGDQKNQKDQKEQKSQKDQKEQNEQNDKKDLKDQKDLKEQNKDIKDQNKDTKETKVVTPEIIQEVKPPTPTEKEKPIQPNQIMKKKGVVPSIRPSEKISPNSQQKLKKPTEGPIAPVSEPQTKEKPNVVQNQQVTISSPNIYKPQKAVEEFQIFENNNKQQNKQDPQKYQKDLDECYSDVEIPQFQFNQLEF